MKEISIFNSDGGCFVLHNKNSCKKLRFNGQEPKDTHNSKWCWVDGEINKLEELVRGGIIHLQQYKLKEGFDNKGVNLPEILPYEDAHEGPDQQRKGYGYVWKDKWSFYEGAYEKDYEHTEDTWKEVEFEIKVLGYIQKDLVFNFTDSKIGITTKKCALSSENSTVDLSTLCTFEDFDGMVPEICRHNTEVTLPSENLYRIIRNYVKKNIDGAYAEITKDYDFCFTVKKVIPRTPMKVRKEKLTAKGNSYRPPRYTEVLDNGTQQMEIFEMTNKEHEYKGCPVLEGLTAPNLEALIDILQDYLETLMEAINAPLKKCDHCFNGYYVADKHPLPK